MTIGVVDRKLLWGRSANRCSWRDCEIRLIVDEGSAESDLLARHGVVLGEEAHIRSRKIDGPRHDPQYPQVQLDTYANLILLCPTHHTRIDKGEGDAWSTETVERIKVDHEAAVERALSIGDLELRDVDEHLAARLELWWSKLDLDRWEAISFGLNQATPLLEDSDWKRLFDAGRWMQALDWPERYPRIARAFQNHRLALWLLTICLHERMTDLRGSLHQVDDPHHRIAWNPALYDELLADRSVSCHAIWLLTMELTRSINFVISTVRAEFDSLYRFEDGIVLMGSGDVVFGATTERLEYQSSLTLLPANPNFRALLSRIEIAVMAGDKRGQAPVDVGAVSVGVWCAPPGL